MTDKWKKLTISGDMNLLSIISADIMQISNGMIEDDKTHTHFIEFEDEQIVKGKLKKYKQSNIKYTFEVQIKEDWHLAWKDNFTPIYINNKLCILPDWDSSIFDGITIKIKPGMAFGTGHHETTYLMLEQLIYNISPKMSVLDLGAGSGVLSIAAKKLGAERVVSVEFDEDCKGNFYENLALNGLSNDISIYFEDVLNWKDLNFDYILANINKNVIVKLIPILSKVQNTNILLTGLLNENKPEILFLLEQNDFEVIEHTNKGEWMLVSIKKRIN